MQNMNVSSSFRLFIAALALLCGEASYASTGTWTGNASSLWTDNANWSGASYAGASTSESATFNSAGNNNTNLNIAGLFSLMNITFDSTNVAAYTVGAGPANSQRVVMGGGGTYKLTSTATNSQTFNCAVMLGGNPGTASYTLQNDNPARLFTFNNVYVTNSGSAGTKTLNVAGAGNTAVLGSITKNAANGVILNKTGTGTLTLAGTNVIATLNVNAGTLALTEQNGSLVTPGTISIANGATLRLDNSEAANHTNRLFDTTPLTLNGTLAFSHAGGATNYSETVGTVTNNGTSVISASQASASQTSSLTLSGLARNASTTLNFTGAGLGESDRNRIFIAGQPDGTLGSWITLNGVSPVFYTSTEGVHLQASTDIAAYGSTIVSNDTANVRINSQGTEGAIALSAPVTIVGSLTQNTLFDATVDTAGKSLQLASASINAAMASLTLGVNPNDGAVSPKDAGGALTLLNDSANTLTVNAVVADNSTPSTLVKAGAGPAVLTAANTFSGGVSVSGGSLVLAHSLALQNVQLGSISGIAFDSSVASHAFTVGGLTNTFALALLDNAANPITLSAGNNNGTSTYGGVLSGAGSFNKVGSGTLTLTAANTHSGGTAVNGGTLVATNANALGAGGVTNNATLNLSLGNVTFSGLSSALSGSGTVNVKLGTTADTNPLDGDYRGFTGIWNLGVGAAGSAGKARMDGPDNAAATVNVLSNATLYVSQPVTHLAAAVLKGGDIGQQFGQLRLDSGAVWAGPVTLAGNFSDPADGFFGSYTGTGTVSGVVGDLGGPHPVTKLYSAVFNLTGTNNTYAGQTWVNEGTLGAASIGNVGAPGSLGQPMSASNGTLRIGNGSLSARLVYLGTGDTSDRGIDMAGTTGGATIEQAGTGLLKFTGGVAASGAGVKTLTLEGSTTGSGELAGPIVNNSLANYTILKKTGAGRWSLSATNTYTGDTQIVSGTLALAHPNAISTSSMIKFPGANGVLELASSGVGETPNNITVNAGYTATLSSGVPSDSSVGLHHALGQLSISTVTVNVIRASNVLSGSPSISAEIVNLNAGSSGTTTFNPTTADLILGGVAILSGATTKNLRLDGTSSGNRIDGPVTNGISVLKDNTSTWALHGYCAYSGSTVLNNGTLVLAGTDGAIAASSSVTLNSGATLRLSNTDAANNTNRLRDAATVALSGGTLDFAHSADAADYSEKIGAVTLSGTGSALHSSQAAEGHASALTLTSLIRSANANLDFSGTGLGSDTRNCILIGGQSPGLIGSWATYNGAGEAAYDATLGVVPGVTADADIAARGPFSTIPDALMTAARITTAGEDGPISLAGATVNSVAALQQNTDTPAVVATAGKTFRTHRIAISTNQAALTIGENVNDGTVTPLAASGKLELANDSASALTVNAALADNGAGSSLVKSGIGDVFLRGTCTYTGPTTIADGALTFASSAPQALAGIVGGSGTLVKSGTNILHLLAANTYAGPTTISQGTLRVNQSTALGATTAGTLIADGATLDLGCTPDVGGTRSIDQLNLQSEIINVRGAGVDGLGAIVNSSTGSQYSALGKVSLDGDTTVSARSRWDIRSNWLLMNDHTLTKLGPDMLCLTSIGLSNGVAGTAQIDVQEGILRLQQATVASGGASNTLKVRSGAELHLYALTGDFGWGLQLDGGASVSLASGSTADLNHLSGPVTLNGPVLITGPGTYTYYGTFLGDISGSGSLLKTNGSYAILASTNNTYTGTTTISGGALYVNSLRNVGQTSSLGQPANASDGTIRIGAGSTQARLTYQGMGDSTDRAIDMAGGTNAHVILDHVGTGLLRFSALTVSGLGYKTLKLQASSNAVGEVSASIANSTHSAGGNISVNKSGSGTWVLSGDNTYSGATTVDGGTLTFKGTNTLEGGMTINSGTVAVQGTNNFKSGSVTLSSSGKSGTLIMSPGSSLPGDGDFSIGYGAGSGALYLNGGTITRTQSAADSNFGFGRSTGSYGYLNMASGTVSAARFQMAGIGSGATVGRGVARISGGSLTFTEYILLSRNAGCESVLTMDGGTITHTVGQNLCLAYGGGRCELNLTGGSINNSGRSVSVLQSGGLAGTGIVNLCAGSLTTAGFISTSNTVALLSFCGGTLKPSAASSSFIPTNLAGVCVYGPFGAYAGGAVIDTAGYAVTVPAALRAPEGQGVYAITLANQGSGYIGEPYVSIEGGSGLGATAVANMTEDGSNNGTFKVASVTVTCPGVNYTTTPTVLFKGGGSNIVTAQVDTVTLTANASGGLTKTGAGTLTLAAANTYAGATTVSGGNLRLGNSAALPTATPVVLSGGTLDLNGFTVTNTVSGTGTLTNGTVQTTLSPAGEGTVGTDTLALTLLSATMAGLYRVDVTDSGSSDLIAVQGHINLSNLTLQVVDTERLDKRRTYTLLTCTGTRSGTFNATNLPDSRWHLTYLSDGTVKLFYAGGTMVRIR